MPGAAESDFVKLVQDINTGCAGSVVSVDGGRLATAGQLQMRVVDRYLFRQVATYKVCHAFNYTGGASDSDYHVQGTLNVTLRYPLQSLRVLDSGAVDTAPTVRKRLTFEVALSAGNSGVRGDAIVILPISVGHCAGAAALHRSADCDATATGDVVPASSLEGGNVLLSRELRLYPAGEYVVCYAFTADLYAPAAESTATIVPTGLPLPPSSPPSLTSRCTSTADYLGTDESFREQYGINLEVRYPITAVEPALVDLGSGVRLSLFHATIGDKVRLLPACELGCGIQLASDTDFPYQFVTLGGNVSSSGLNAASYKACYAYSEDYLTASQPDLAHVVEVPVSQLNLVVQRSPSPPPTTLGHLETLSARVAVGDWAWFRLPLVCASGSPLPGCVEGEDLAAAIELDANFNSCLLRYESLHLLVAHEPVLEPTYTDAQARARLPSSPLPHRLYLCLHRSTHHLCYRGATPPPPLPSPTLARGVFYPPLPAARPLLAALLRRPDAATNRPPGRRLCPPRRRARGQRFRAADRQ